MAWLCVDKDGSENINQFKPDRYDDYWWHDDSFVCMPSGSIEKLIGQKMTWEDEAVEI